MFSIKNTINVAFTILFNGFLAFRMCIKRPKRKMVCFFNVVCTEITEDILLAQESFALWSIFYLFQKGAKTIYLLQYNTSQVLCNIPIRLVSASAHLKEIATLFSKIITKSCKISPIFLQITTLLSKPCKILAIFTQITPTCPKSNRNLSDAYQIY